MNFKTAQIFVDRLKKQKKDPASMAKMRMFVRNGNDWQACSVVEKLIPAFVDKEWDRKCMYVVACLYAHHPKVARKINFGDTLRKISLKKLSDGSDRKKSVEHRLMSVLNCNQQDILDRIFQEILYVRSIGAPVNYAQLLMDLVYWGDRSKQKWAISFYRRKNQLS